MTPRYKVEYLRNEEFNDFIVDGSEIPYIPIAMLNGILEGLRACAQDAFKVLNDGLDVFYGEGGSGSTAESMRDLGNSLSLRLHQPDQDGSQALQNLSQKRLDESMRWYLDHRWKAEFGKVDPPLSSYQITGKVSVSSLQKRLSNWLDLFVRVDFCLEISPSGHDVDDATGARKHGFGYLSQQRLELIPQTKLGQVLSRIGDKYHPSEMNPYSKALPGGRSFSDTESIVTEETDFWNPTAHSAGVSGGTGYEGTGLQPSTSASTSHANPSVTENDHGQSYRTSHLADPLA